MSDTPTTLANGEPITLELLDGKIKTLLRDLDAERRANFVFVVALAKMTNLNGPALFECIEQARKLFGREYEEPVVDGYIKRLRAALDPSYDPFATPERSDTKKGWTPQVVGSGKPDPEPAAKPATRLGDGY